MDLRSLYKKEPGLMRIIVLLAVVAAAILAYDIWEVATGAADLNRHIPFFLPVVLAAFIGICIKMASMWSSAPPDARERIKEDAERRSYLNRENLPSGRSGPDNIE